ncbi:MAG: hypothetical protein JSS66_18860 [Armatimonadetes bacterium]|nr:hypothetical protein [Armatimonadota bacterium]
MTTIPDELVEAALAAYHGPSPNGYAMNKTGIPRDPTAEIVPLRPRAATVDRLRLFGTGRVVDNDKAVLVIFSRRLTDDELRFFDEVCGRTAPLMDGVHHG